MPTEQEYRADVRAQVLRHHATLVGLLRALTSLAQNQLAELDGRQVDGEGRRLQLMLVSQSLNAAHSAFNLLTDGYPRMALALARIMREGHIAFRWSSANEEDVAEHFRNFRSSSEKLRGSWPTVGEMAKHLPDTFQHPRYQQFQSDYREAHNTLFSHAVSDWSLSVAHGRSKDGTWTPAIGPFYDSEVTEMAGDHLVPLFLWVMVDAAEFTSAILGGPTNAEGVQPLVDRVAHYSSTRQRR